jgi:hypothetical protein
MPWGFLLLHSIGQVFVKSVEVLLPECAVLRDPAGGGVERGGVEPAVVDAPLAPPLEQPGVLQDLQVPGDRGQRNVERRRELRD